MHQPQAVAIALEDQIAAREVAENDVLTCLIVDDPVDLGAGAEHKAVIARSAEQRVATRVPVEAVGTRRPEDRVVAIASASGVVAVPAANDIVAAAAIQDVVATVAGNHVLAGSSQKPV